MGAIATTTAQSVTATSLDRVIGGALVVSVEKLLEPLQELEIVLKPAFHQLVYGHYLHGGRQAETKSECTGMLQPFIYMKIK